MQHSAGRLCVLLIVVALIPASATLQARTVTAPAPELSEGATWTVWEVTGHHALPVIDRGWEKRTFWDLRPVEASGRLLRWTVLAPADAGLSAVAAPLDANRALCLTLEADGSPIGCKLFRNTEATAAGTGVVAGSGPADLGGGTSSSPAWNRSRAEPMAIRSPSRSG